MQKKHSKNIFQKVSNKQKREKFFQFGEA